MGLALLSFDQSAIWASSEALWTQAARIAPTAPRPRINLAVEAMDRGELDRAEGFLAEAAQLAVRQPPFEAEWAADLLEANWAILDIRRGRFDDARWRLHGAPPFSARAQACRMFPTICPP